MPNIGYGSDKRTRHYLPNGFKKFVLSNVKDLELLMMHNRWSISSTNLFWILVFCFWVFYNFHVLSSWFLAYNILHFFNFQDLLCRDCSQCLNKKEEGNSRESCAAWCCCDKQNCQITQSGGWVVGYFFKWLYWNMGYRLLILVFYFVFWKL